MSIIPFFFAAFAVRLVSLFISISNEKKLKAAGAQEYGKLNSLFLTLAHVAFYAGCVWEGAAMDRHMNALSFAGLALFGFSMGMLAIVIRQLGSLWTVKLILASTHPINHSFLFRYVRHPNYFLNVLPELVAIALLCQAWNVLAIGLPLYLIPLGIRIYQEEKIMRRHFPQYGN